MADTSTYQTTLSRRCHGCDAKLSGRVDDDRWNGCDVVCADCGLVTRRDPIRCPWCLRIARWDERGDLACPGGCAPLARPHHHTLDASVPCPKRGGDWSEPGPGECERGLPLAGWERVLRDRVRSCAGTEQGDTAIAVEWGLGEMLTGWGDYGERYGRAGGGLRAQWGEPDDDGREQQSQGGAEYEAARLENLLRMVEMTDALDAFAAAIVAVPTNHKTDKGKPSTALFACYIAAQHERRAVTGYPYGDPAMAIAAAQHHRDALDAFAREDHWEWLHTFGGAICRALVNAIVGRGGSYQGTNELLSYAEAHETAFGSYRASLWWAFYGPVKGLGEGSPMAGLGNAGYTHGLPGGILMQEEGISLHPSRNASAGARNVNAIHLDRDVWACIGSARIGGIWDRADPERPDAARLCGGGRAVTTWEMELVRLCDVGCEVAVSKGKRDTDWRRLTVVEAVARVRAEAVSREKSGQSTWGRARHLTAEEAKTALTRARRALTDALVAWRMIPLRTVEPRAKPVRVDTDGPPRQPTAVPRDQMAHATWDTEAL